MTTISIHLSFQGKVVPLEGITPETTGRQLYQQTFEALNLSSSTTSLKILAKGKRLPDDETRCGFQSSSSTKPLKLIVMATSAVVVADLASKRSDPTIRGFDRDLEPRPSVARYLPWGETHGQQDKNYKFCRFEACTWQSFGHRIDDAAPHAFAAMQLLERLAMDPGVVAVMRERELVVGTLGEMDPIDDRIMQKKQQTEGACLLGYNTNGGARIDIKLRTDNLKGFRPYPELVATLLHELSHNWVGEHNLLFWTNFGQMRAEYLTRHRALQSSLVNGKTTAELADLNKEILERIPETILNELVREMAQHGLHPRMIETPIRQRCQELEQELLQGKRLGGGAAAEVVDTASVRERALAAAEQRRKQQEKDSSGSQDAT
jgi:hypothetical protein